MITFAAIFKNTPQTTFFNCILPMMYRFFQRKNFGYGCVWIAFYCLSLPVFSQSPSDSTPFHLNWRLDLPILAGGLGLNAISYFSVENLGSRSELEIQEISPVHLLKIDKKATDNFDLSADKASDFMVVGSAFLPLTLMADKDIRQDAKKISVLLSETILLTHGLTLVTKRLTLRNRPYVYNPEVPLEDKLTVSPRLSFFSGHTSMTAGFSFFTAKVWSDYHPYSRWKPVVWTAAATIPAVTGYLRYKAGKHYFTDVAAGYAVGALVGYLVPHLHKIDTKSKRKLRLSSDIREGTPVFVVRCLW